MKSDLYSWEVCLGISQMPQSIKDQTSKKIILRGKGHKSPCQFTKEMEVESLKIINFCLDERMSTEEINERLIEAKCIIDPAGEVLSFHTVKKLITKIRKSRGESVQNLREKIMIMKHSGLRHETIQAKLKLNKLSYVDGVVARYYNKWRVEKCKNIA